MSKVFENRDSFHYNFMIMALAGHKVTDKMKEYPRTITMQLNGEEIDANRALSRLDKSLDEYIEKRADDIVASRINDILNPFEEQVEELTEDLRTVIRAKVKEHFKLP